MQKEVKHPALRAKRTLGQKASDRLAQVAGSWTFIITLATILLLWVAINAYFFVEYELGNPWDPYPFILLNLVLSTIAAIQAPIILMSQNRHAQKDRLMAEYDYEVNKKSEKEIEELKKQLDRIERKLK